MKKYLVECTINLTVQKGSEVYLSDEQAKTAAGALKEVKKNANKSAEQSKDISKA